MSLRSQRGGKLYGAAFPMLDSLAVERAWAAGQRACQWTNEQGVVVGHVVLEELTTDTLVMTTHLLGAVNVGYRFGRDHLALERQRRNHNHDRPSFVCPECGRSVQIVFAVNGRWACRLCHDLVSVARLLGPVTKHQRRLVELRLLLERGRPRYGKVAAFAALKEEHGRLLHEFSHAPPLPHELGFLQQAAWLALDDPRIKREVADGEPGYGWTRYDTGGFKRLTWLAEQEHRVHGEAEIATRGRPAAAVIKPHAAKQQGRREAPFTAGQPPKVNTPPNHFRFDPVALMPASRRGFGDDDASDGDADLDKTVWRHR